MKTTMTLSTNLNCSPFEIFDQDVDEVIMLINFYLKLGETEGTVSSNKPQKHNDGFWDF